MSIMFKLNLEDVNKRSSVISQWHGARDSVLSLISSEKRRRSKRTITEPNTPKTDRSPTSDLLGFSKEIADRLEKDKFLDIFEKSEKDYADGRAIYRKLVKNAFFEENKALFEEELDPEGIICLCKGLTLETFQESDVVYEKGDKMNDKIYFVYKGETEVLQMGEVTLKQSTFSNMSRDLNDSPPLQPRPRFSLLCRHHNLESEITFDPSTGRRSLNLKTLMATNPNLKPLIGKKICSGEYFGGEILNSEQLTREETIIVNRQTHLLVLNVKDLEYIKKRYERKTIEKLNFLLKHLSIPLKNEHEVKNKFFNSMTEKVLPLGEILLNEREWGKSFYFLFDGKCEVQKKLKDSHTEAGSPKTKPHKTVSVCSVENGTFLGEELLFNDNIGYDYTIKVVSAKAVFVRFDVLSFKHTFDKEIIASLQESYQEKTAKHQEIFQSIAKELSKRNSKPLSNGQTKSPTHAHNASPNLGFGAKWDLINTESHLPNPYDKEQDPIITSGRNENVANKKRYSTMLPVLEKNPQAEKRNSLTNKGITMIKDQILPFHHQQVMVTKQDRIGTEENSSPMMKKKIRTKGHAGTTLMMTKETEHDEYAFRNKGYDSLDEVVPTHMRDRKIAFQTHNKMDEYLNSIDNFAEESPKRSKNDKFINDIEKFKLNFGDMESEKRAYMSPHHHSNNEKNSRGSFLDSPAMSHDNQRDIVILNPGKMRSNGHHSKSPIRKGSKTIKLPNPNSKINLESLRNQFFETPHKGSMRDYLAKYKQAHLQNKLSRNIAASLQLKEADCAIMKKPRMLPHLTNIDYSPKIKMLTENDALVMIPMPKSDRANARGNGTLFGKNRSMLEPISQKNNPLRINLPRGNMTDREN